MVAPSCWRNIRSTCDCARRQYDAVDPANRLVAAELERRWNQALTTEAQLEAELATLQQGRERPLTDTQKRELLSFDLVEVVRLLARMEPDARIASILNRSQRRTAHGQNWTTKRIGSLRNNHAIPVYREGERQTRSEMSVSEVTVVLGVTPTCVLRLIRLQQLPAARACVGAPWILRRVDVERCVAERSHPATPPTVDSAQLIFEIS
jgi:hypothetical protein